MQQKKLLPPLREAIEGKVVTRLPPEASGFLHLGHVKALLLNYMYARQYHGKVILRFDDTNPEKENIVYEEAIMADIKKLGLECDMHTYSSDYFDQVIDYGRNLINSGLAYIDFSSAKEINKCRIQFQPSKYRDTDIATNLLWFAQMLNGDTTECCLRAKIDYASKNGCLRDPVIFRCKNQYHPRHGTKYYVYPTYDFACPIIDAIEGVTHAMRSVEYKDRDSQYEWFLRSLGLKNGPYPIIMDYSKLNFTHTVLSKRKLAKLVDAGLVDGWSDPRLPTVRGILRRGMQVESLLSYIKTQLTGRNIVLLGWEKIWSVNSVNLDKKSMRLYGFGPDMRMITMTGDLPSYVELVNHPKDQSFGTREIQVTSKLFVDVDDFREVIIGARFTLVGLGNATVTNINPLTLHYDKTDTDYKTTTKITWLPNDGTNVLVTVKNYGTLLNKPKIEENEDVTDAFNTDSLVECQWLVESAIKNVNIGQTVQIMRHGYCYVDKNDGDDIVLHMVPNK